MANINNSNNFETLKKKYFSDWINETDIYTVNKKNRGTILPDNNKPIKFDLDDSDLKPLDCDSHIINNACKDNTCDFKIIIPHKYAIEKKQEKAYHQYILDNIQRYKTETGIYVNKNKVNLNVENDVPVLLLGNLYKDLHKYKIVNEQGPITPDNIIKLQSYYNNDKKDVLNKIDPYEQLYINLYNILFSNTPEDASTPEDKTKLKNMFKINTLFTQTLYGTITPQFLYLYCKYGAEDFFSIYIPSKQYPLKYEYYTNGSGMEIIAKLSGSISKIDRISKQYIDEQLTTYTYVDLNKDNPDYYVRMIIDDTDYKLLYRNNGLSYEEEAIKKKKILFI